MDWNQTLVEFVLPIAGAAVAGGLIGLEREYRGRPAGLRTHILVCLASAFLMLAAIHQVRWLADTPPALVRIDPVRMAHGILTGIGFLCGGVIFRQGLSVHGLTTAASLWITSALGVLYGIGFFGLAVAGTAVTLLVLAGFRWFDSRVPQAGLIEASLRGPREGGLSEAAFRALTAEFGLHPSGVSCRLTDGGATVEVAATLHGRRRADSEALAKRLMADPRVVEFELNLRND